jgi:hypothetical protein
MACEKAHAVRWRLVPDDEPLIFEEEPMQKQIPRTHTALGMTAYAILRTPVTGFPVYRRAPILSGRAAFAGERVARCGDGRRELAGGEGVEPRIYAIYANGLSRSR